MNYFSDEDVQEIFQKIVTNERFALGETAQNGIPYTLWTIDATHVDLLDSTGQQIGTFRVAWGGTEPGVYFAIGDKIYTILRREERWQAALQEDASWAWFDL